MYGQFVRLKQENTHVNDNSYTTHGPYAHNLYDTRNLEPGDYGTSSTPVSPNTQRDGKNVASFLMSR